MISHLIARRQYINSSQNASELAIYTQKSKKNGGGTAPPQSTPDPSPGGLGPQAPQAYHQLNPALQYWLGSN